MKGGLKIGKLAISVRDLDIFKDVMNCLDEVVQDERIPEGVRKEYNQKLKRIAENYSKGDSEDE